MPPFLVRADTLPPWLSSALADVSALVVLLGWVLCHLLVRMDTLPLWLSSALADIAGGCSTAGTLGATMEMYYLFAGSLV